ncbi:MAG: hypothetical protein AAFV69_04295, partial [Pseudomonadota bacterium]
PNPTLRISPEFLETVICEVLMGTANFGDVVRLVPGTHVHMIPSGAAFAASTDGLDPDQLNLILDALDEAYDQIIIIATKPQGGVLFEAIQGRFDAGVTVLGNEDLAAYTPSKPGTFLGFDVTDIELIHYANQPTQAETRGKRQLKGKSQDRTNTPPARSEAAKKRLAAVAAG